MYGRYVRAQIGKEKDTNLTDLIVREAKMYPYLMKREIPVKEVRVKRGAQDYHVIHLQVPYFDWVGVTDLPFHAGITDEGVCDVYNGNNLISTYSEAAVAKTLADKVDPR